MPSEDLPPFAEVLEEARRQRAGPPLHPWAVAYPHVLALARDILWREIKNKRRRDGVVAELATRVGRIEKKLKNCKTLGDQLQALDQVIGHAHFRRLDLRGRRARKGPDDSALRVEYECVHPRVKALFGRKSDRNYGRLSELLAIEFPHLSPEQLAEAVSDKPSWGAYVVVGARHELSPARVRDRIGATRKKQK